MIQPHRNGVFSQPQPYRKFQQRQKQQFPQKTQPRAPQKLAVAGGVAANSRIRKDITEAAEKIGATVYMPPLSLCGDNAAMIGAQAYYEYQSGNTADMSLNAYATKSIIGEKI